MEAAYWVTDFCYRRGIFKESHDYIVKAIENLQKLMILQEQMPEETTSKYKSLLYLRQYAQMVLQSCAIKS